MRVPVGQFGAVHLRRIDLGELDLCLWRDSHQLDSSPEGELLEPRGEAVVDDDRVRVEGRPRDARVELAPALLHRPDYVDHRRHLGVLELVQHLPHRQALPVDVAHLYQLGQLAAREQEVVRLPEILLGDRLVDTDDGVLESLLGAFFLALGGTGAGDWAGDFLFRFELFLQGSDHLLLDLLDWAVLLVAHY